MKEVISREAIGFAVAVLLGIALTTILTGCSTPSASSQRGIPLATPETVGVSSHALNEALEDVAASGLNLHSLLVVKNGVLVLEAYFDPFTAEVPHRLHSVNKSVLALAVGIAVEREEFPPLATPLVDILPAARETVPAEDPRSEITIAHLLGNSSGISWDEHAVPAISPENINQRYRSADDKVEFLLERPLVAQPGTRFTYNTGGYDVVTRLLEATTETDAYQYAMTRLLAPLGIEEADRHADLSSRSLVLSELLLRPRDMAVLGQALVEGGRGVVPTAWLARSWTPAVRAFGWWYGLGWWIDQPGVYSAKGNGGQRITVVPDEGVVVVVTAGLEPDFGPGVPELDRLIHGRLLPVLTRDHDELQPDRRGARTLQRTVRRLARGTSLPGTRVPAWLGDRVDLAGPSGSAYERISIRRTAGGLDVAMASSAVPSVIIPVRAGGAYSRVDHPILGTLFARTGVRDDGSLVVQVQLVSVASDRLTLEIKPEPGRRAIGTVRSEVEGLTLPLRGVVVDGS